MKRNITIALLRSSLAALSIISVGGCAGNGYITSSVNTVIGMDVSENPKTQVPHIKFGYARSGIYYVPTGKTAGSDGATGKASDTPEVVSDIFVHSKFLTGMTISEKFAIGKEAVRSNAADTAFAVPAAQMVAAGEVPAEVTNAFRDAAKKAKETTWNRDLKPAKSDKPAPSVPPPPPVDLPPVEEMSKSLRDVSKRLGSPNDPKIEGVLTADEKKLPGANAATKLREAYKRGTADRQGAIAKAVENLEKQ